MLATRGLVNIQVRDHRQACGDHAEDPPPDVGIGVVILAELEGDLVVTVGHREMIEGVSPPLGLVKGLLVVDRIGDRLPRVSGGASRCRGVVTPGIRAPELLVREPGRPGTVRELGPPGIGPDS
jgi:hypothetical protein